MGKSGKRIPFGQRPLSRSLVLLTASTQSGSVTIAPTITSPGPDTDRSRHPRLDRTGQAKLSKDADPRDTTDGPDATDAAECRARQRRGPFFPRARGSFARSDRALGRRETPSADTSTMADWEATARISPANTPHTMTRQLRRRRRRGGILAGSWWDPARRSSGPASTARGVRRETGRPLREDGRAGLGSAPAHPPGHGISQPGKRGRGPTPRKPEDPARRKGAGLGPGPG